MKNVYSIILCAVVLFTAFAKVSYSAPAYPNPIEFKQPDGSIITLVLKGDEKVKWAETIDGYTILSNRDGFYEYANISDDGDLILSGVRVTQAQARDASTMSFLQHIPKGISYSKSQVSHIKALWEINDAETKAFPTTGSRKLVCILIGFKDKAFTKTNTEFVNLFNQVGYTTGGATGSVKDYYLENSYGQFNLTVDVFGPFTASQNMSYYGANDSYGNDVRPRELVTEAVKLADAQANYANYDNDADGKVDAVYVIYAGYGEEAGGGANCIWAHAWNISTITLDGKQISSYSCSAELRGSSGTTITSIGVICHEFGHTLGAPDYYDTNYSTGGQFNGTGNWDMMASGSWNNSGLTPAHHNAFTKIYIYNWATATTLSSAANITVLNSAENKSFYRINTATSGEYFLLENREKHKFDAYLPGSGMLIYHVHSGVMTSAASNTVNTTHPQRMYPKCASATTNPSSTPSSYGSINSAGCPYPGSANKTSFTDTTTPHSKSWAGANTAKPITSITRNATNKTVSFAFMGGGSTVTVPTVSTTAASNITSNSATSGGNVTATGGATVTERGIVFATTQSPTLSNSKVVSGSGTGTFSANMSGLAASTTYYVRAYATNSAGTAYGSQISFTTLAATVTYCASKGNNSTYEWIDLVQFAGINRTSGNDNGYIYITSQTASVVRGTTVPIYFSAGFQSTAYTEYWAVWIDFNQNGTFDTAEKVVSGSSSSSGTLSANIVIPSTALLGQTRMRVSMKYNAAQTACEAFAYGEVEDYIVNIASSKNEITFESNAFNDANVLFAKELDLTPASPYTIYPNPAYDRINIELQGIKGNISIRIYNVLGVLVYDEIADNQSTTIDISSLNKGVYFIYLDEEKEPLVKKFIKQ
jgi:M6 family metalloprotease-like protein